MCISRLAFRSTTFSNFAINGAPKCFFGAICGSQAEPIRVYCALKCIVCHDHPNVVVRVLNMLPV